MQIVKARSVRSKISRTRKLILSAGNSFGCVHFVKRSDGTKRRMSYRLHVSNPTWAPKPSGRGRKPKRTDVMTVFDVNAVRYNKRGGMCGRGDYRTIPLDAVCRIAVGGKIYRFV